jgi:hypothetical protein
MSGSLFLGVRIVSTAIDALVAVAVVTWLSRRWGLGASLAVAVGAAGSAFVGKLLAWSVLGLGLFGVVHLAYLDLIATPPSTASAPPRATAPASAPPRTPATPRWSSA